jgi:hypothetical protein
LKAGVILVSDPALFGNKIFISEDRKKKKKEMENLHEINLLDMHAHRC